MRITALNNSDNLEGRILESCSDEELVAALTDRIKAAFSNGYEKGVAEGRLEMKKAVLTAIEKL